MPNPSPLTEADPNSISEAIARIDRDLSLGNVPHDSDIETIVQRLRAQREQWQNLESGGRGRKVSGKKEVTSNLDLKDLGL